MNITNSDVNEPDSSERLISICYPLVDGPNMHVLMVGGNRSTCRKRTQPRGEHENPIQRGPAPAGIEPRTLLMLYKPRTFLL